MVSGGVVVLSTAHDHGASVVADTSVELAVFFVIGLLAGAHCLGMCGPLVSAYADRINATSAARRSDTLTLFAVRQHALFNLGRAGSYTLIGAFFGLLGWLAFGSAEAVAAAGDTLRGGVGLVVGAAIIIAGVYYLRGRAGLPHGVPAIGPVVAHLTTVMGRHIDRLATGPAIVGLGSLHGLLPCPIIYPAYLYAFAIGDPLRGGLALLILGIGTIPTLFAYGTILGTVSTRSRIRLHRALGVAFIVLGYIPLQHGLMLLGIAHLPHPPIPYWDPL